MTTLEPGIHTINADTYHADPAERPSLSASIAHLLLEKSPKHAWIIHPRLGAQRIEKDESKFDPGTAAHILLLENRPELLHEVEAKDWRSKAAQEVRDVARANGLIPLLSHQYKLTHEIVASIREQIATLEIDPPLFADGKAEQSLIWEERGVLCRSRLDWLRDDLAACDDLKTTKASAHPQEWTRRTMWSIGADIEAAFHTRGIQALTGRRPPMRFVVVESTPPFALSTVTLGPDAIALADAKIDRALELWKRCLDTSDWPAYPRQLFTAEMPSWREASWFDREALEEMGEEVVA